MSQASRERAREKRQRGFVVKSTRVIKKIDLGSGEVERVASIGVNSSEAEALVGRRRAMRIWCEQEGCGSHAIFAGIWCELGPRQESDLHFAPSPCVATWRHFGP